MASALVAVARTAFAPPSLMSAAAGSGRAVDVVLGAKLVGERCLVLSAIDGNGFEAELCSVLHPKMAEAPKPQYRCGLTRPDTAVAERVERGNSGTHQRGSVYRG